MTIQSALAVHATRLEYVCAGDHDPESSTALIREAFEAAVAWKRTAILIDARDVAGEMTIAQRYAFGTAVAAVQQEREDFRGIRCAIVGSRPLVDPQRLGQLVARNRGGDFLVTEDPAEAVDWLEERSR